MNDSALTTHWLFLIALRAATRDCTKQTYHIKVTDVILVHHVVCDRFHSGKRIVPNSILLRESLSPLSTLKLTTESEAFQRQSRFQLYSYKSCYRENAWLVWITIIKSWNASCAGRNTVSVLFVSTKWQFETRSFQKTGTKFFLTKHEGQCFLVCAISNAKSKEKKLATLHKIQKDTSDIKLV